MQLLPRLVTPEQLRATRDRFAKAQLKLVLTNGCFDLLHVGHVRYLKAARALGNAGGVALKSNEAVRALKGPSRPLNTEWDRAEVLSALACVDFVTVFSEPRATRLIEAVRPMVYAKGGDYTVDSLDPGERAALEACGAEIRILPLVPGKSTTGLIQRMGGEGKSGA